MRKEDVAAITVVIADRDKRRTAMCSRLLKRARGIRVLRSVTTVSEAVDVADRRPDILLLDLRMTKDNDLAGVAVIRARSPRTRIILLTGRASHTQTLDAISQGARGYLSASLLRKFLVKAVRAVSAGESWVSRAMVASLIDRLADLTAKTIRARAR